MYEYIEKNISIIRDKIDKSLELSGRKKEDLKLIAVSKTADVHQIQKAMECGIDSFGENRVQDLLEKIEYFNGIMEQRFRPKWHMIGHLQTNKVSDIIGKVELIHSLDSIRLADEIEKVSIQKNIETNCLIQLNVSGEDTKFGIAPEELSEFLSYISQKSKIRIKGLMTIAPNSKNFEEIRKIFKKIFKILVDKNEILIHNVNMTLLSMGMTNDFEIAVQEGANLLRIGTAIFSENLSYPEVT